MNYKRIILFALVLAFCLDAFGGNIEWNQFPFERFSVSAKLSLSPDRQGEIGGIAVTGAECAGIKVVETPEGVGLKWFRAAEGAEGEETAEIASFDSSVKDVWVRLGVLPKVKEGSDVPDVTCSFSYSIDGKSFKGVGSGHGANPGELTGAKCGFLPGRDDAPCMDVSDIRVKQVYYPQGGFLEDESGVPEYELPDVLTTQKGKKVKTVRRWERKRRKEIVKLFESEVYGSLPKRLPKPSFKVVSEEEALNGLAIRKNVKIDLGAGNIINLLLYVPANHEGKVPAFLGINFKGNHAITEEPDIDLPDTTVLRSDFIVDKRGENARRWPLEMILSRGYAVATFCCEDVWPDSEWYPELGVGAAYPGTWGSIAAWGWGLSCSLDYLIKDKDVDGKKVAVIGHSRLGKTALWAGARDKRFAMVVSNDSGCGGAALSRRRFGETVKKINISFPHWFTDRFKLYDDNEDALPVDQHELLALVAPRPLYVASATEDLWADPLGEFLSLSGASKVYALYGTPEITPEDRPAPGMALEKGVLGAHLRIGPHDINSFDWEHYLDFADKHLK